MSVQHLLPELKGALLDLLFPLHCLGCGAEGSLLCSSCSQALPRVGMPYCQHCGVSIEQGDLCTLCGSSPPAIDGMRSLFVFEGTIREAIHHFKYKRLKALAVPLGELLAEYIYSYPLDMDLLMAVPLHPKRLRERGFNQAALLAQELGKLSSIPVADNLLLRLRDTAPQARALSSDQRSSNVQTAFGCRQRIDGVRVLLIDDVCTTGATLDACAVALKDAGACFVWGLTLAREM
ncbi:ComF family protein [Chloroflexota bacterium]